MMQEAKDEHYIRVSALLEEEDMKILKVDITKESQPYYVRKDSALRPCRFDCLRGVTYLPAILWGLISSCFEFLVVCFGCRSTYEVQSDAEFARLFTTQLPFCTMLETTTHVFGHEVGAPEEQVLVFSSDDIALFEPYLHEGTYVQPLRILFRKTAEAGVWAVDTITVGGKQELTRMNDGHTDAWAAAKLFAWNAMHYFAKLRNHSYTHFCQDVFIAACLECLPDENHELRQLMDPHSDFTIDINHGVLATPKSPLNSGTTSLCCYDTHTATRPGNQRMVERGFEIGFQAGRMKFAPLKLQPELQPYFDVILTFTTAVVVALMARLDAIPDVLAREKEHQCLIRWAGFVKQQMFVPVDFVFCHADAAAAYHVEVAPLANFLAYHIFSVSVGHSAEHYLFSNSNQRMQPMSIHVPWSRDMTLPGGAGDPNTCCAWRCCGFGAMSSSRVVPLALRLKQIMYNNMLAKWWNNWLYSDGRLCTTQYAFADGKLQQAAQTFRLSLQAVSPANATNNNVPLNRISRSIQW